MGFLPLRSEQTRLCASAFSVLGSFSAPMSLWLGEPRLPGGPSGRNELVCQRAELLIRRRRAPAWWCVVAGPDGAARPTTHGPVAISHATAGLAITCPQPVEPIPCEEALASPVQHDKAALVGDVVEEAPLPSDVPGRRRGAFRSGPGPAAASKVAPDDGRTSEHAPPESGYSFIAALSR